MFFCMSENTSSSQHVAPAVVGSMAALGSAAWRGVENLSAQVSTLPDNIPVIGGLAIGIMGIGWSIYSAGPDRRAKTLIDEISTLREQIVSRDITIKNQDMAITASLSERNKLLAEIGRLEGMLAKYQAQALNSQPTPNVAPIQP
jgi:hypothetical protein